MPESLFDIVFRGDLMPGHKLPEVKARLARLFKIDAARVEPLFSGAAVVLKRNLDRATADKYVAALQAAGAAVSARPVQAQQSGQAQSPAPPGLTLAPVGADLLSPAERGQVQAPVLDLSQYSIRPAEGYLLDDAERRSTAPAQGLDADFELAPVGADLGQARPAIAPVDLVADFDLAEPGADLLKPEERSEQAVRPISTDHITLA